MTQPIKHETIDMDINRYIDCTKLKSGDHEFVVIIDDKKYNLAIRKDCDSAFVHRWDFGVNTGSRSDGAANPAFATLGAKAVLNPNVIINLAEIASAIATIKQYNTSIGLDVREW